MDIAVSLYYKEINKLFRKNHINQLFGLTRMSTKGQSALFRKPGMGGVGKVVFPKFKHPDVSLPYF